MSVLVLIVGLDGRMAVANLPCVDIWAGSSLGILKAITVSDGKFTNYLPTGMAVKDTTRCMEILDMCWEYNSEEKIFIGLKNGYVQCFDASAGQFTGQFDATGGSGQLIGIEKHKDALITCTDKGTLTLWPKEAEKVEIHQDKPLTCMRANSECHLQVATGGKENDLKLWDGNKPEKPTFQAKNVRNDWLDLRVPVWVTQVCFVPETGDQPTVAVGTGYHQVRLYDTRKQRRPLYTQEFGETPITALDVTPDSRYIIIGNGAGVMGKLDLRVGKVLNTYKGATGSIRCVKCHHTLPVVAACGLDRFVRIYNLEDKKLLNKIYTKLHSNCLLFSSRDFLSKHSSSPQVQQSNDDSEEEDLWSTMPTLDEPPKKRQRKQMK
ncbi:WD repeat-containing protein 74-like [Dysidea avara]|uniref:WD repeat-containing protein 74-like n=1 Tax=Dysidea avara TaxID=196820 RepID=UPI003333ECF0